MWPSQATDLHLLIPAIHPGRDKGFKMEKAGTGSGVWVAKNIKDGFEKTALRLHSAPTQEEAHSTFPNWKGYHQTTLPM